MRDVREFSIADVYLSILTYPAAIAAIGEMAERTTPCASRVLVHANCHTIFSLRSVPALRAILERRALLVAEGVGLRIAGRLLGWGAIPVVNGSDLFPALMNATCGLKLFLVGGAAGVAESAAAALVSTWPQHEVVGVWHGEYERSEERRILACIDAAQPDIVLLGLGSPRQEETAIYWAERCDVPLLWTVGGLMDLLSGRSRRAPARLRAMGLEWAFRLYREPRRLWRRTFVEGPWLVAMVLRELGARLAAGARRRDGE